MYVLIVIFLTILNSGADYRTFTLYRQYYFVNKGGKTVNFRFLNQINVFNAEMFVFFCIENIMEMFVKSFEYKRQIFVVRLQLIPNKY